MKWELNRLCCILIGWQLPLLQRCLRNYHKPLTRNITWALPFRLQHEITAALYSFYHRVLIYKSQNSHCHLYCCLYSPCFAKECLRVVIRGNCWNGVTWMMFLGCFFVWKGMSCGQQINKLGRGGKIDIFLIL